MSALQHICGKLSKVHIEEISLKEPFLNVAARFAETPGTVLLMSGGNQDTSRYHILGVNPWLTIKGRGNSLTVTADGKTSSFEADPFETLDNVLKFFRLEGFDSDLPVVSGLMGYLAYDLKDNLERLPRTSVDNLNLPHICMFGHSILLIHDKNNNKTFFCAPVLKDANDAAFHNKIEEFRRILNKDLPEDPGFFGSAHGFQSNFSKEDYIKAVQKIREYIASGEVYQVNLSQQFEMDFYGSGFSLFKSLFDHNPASFFAYINAGDHEIVSTSPERFILQKGTEVETRPIKGTRPRGKTPSEDKAKGSELLASKKDDAELSMIVDLLRNDMGKVCEGGSVHVREHKRLEAYENVFHLVSVVEGTLMSKLNSVDLIKAVFPGGSITGCPKIRSMEIIDELEPHRRHIYTGSIGYISFHDTMDLSIAIRTALIYNNNIFFSAGGGIVYDSVPIDEFEETLHKGRTLMAVFENRRIENTKDNKVWINGSLKDRKEACIPVMDQGFQYGYGFFETIRVQKGSPEHLNAHIKRFNKAWNTLFFEKEPDLTWNDIILNVIKANNLENETAAVKIIATKGDREDPPFHHSLVVSAKPYTHRLSGKEDAGLHLLVYGEPRQTPLADHKTLNYLYYLLAGKWAKENGADEALILNPDGTISETNTANIILLANKTVTLPSSRFVLAGIMHENVCRVLKKWGYSFEEKKVYPEDLFSYQVIVTNSLMGAVPVTRLNGKDLSAPFDLIRKINQKVMLK